MQLITCQLFSLEGDDDAAGGRATWCGAGTRRRRTAPAAAAAAATMTTCLSPSRYSSGARRGEYPSSLSRRIQGRRTKRPIYLNFQHFSPFIRPKFGKMHEQTCVVSSESRTNLSVESSSPSFLTDLPPAALTWLPAPEVRIIRLIKSLSNASARISNE